MDREEQFLLPMVEKNPRTTTANNNRAGSLKNTRTPNPG